ncbi:MAG TPA: helix-turn-helix domain-containing protein [Candidatus Competibacteraceae bacterium]|nr:helix-turn-helix domain-containing protein [Candidatus Competibacteraceae bacterium]
MSETLLSTRETADYLRVSPSTLQWWRRIGRGPSFVRTGGYRLFYTTRDLDDYIARQRVVPSEIGQQA